MNLGKFVGSAAVSAIKEWNPLGPEAYARRDLNKAFRKARRRAKRGETLTEQEAEILKTTEEVSMFPKNTMRNSGVTLVGFAPIVAIGLRFFGVTEACTPEAIEAGCVTADAMAASLLAGLGSILYVVGRIRAEKREAGEK